MKTIAIQIVSYNSEGYIKKCLQCLSKQTYTDFSVYIIDNASSDKTISICKFFPVVIIQNKTNIGYSAAHNQGLRLAKSKYVLTLNPDVFLQPDFLKAMVETLEREPQVGSAAGLLLRINGVNEKPVCIDGAGLFMRKNRRQGLFNEGDKIHAPQQRCILGPDGAAAFYRRKMLEDIAIYKEVFDEDFFMHKEDVDIVWRAQRAGWTSLFVPNAIAWHIRTFRSGQRNIVPPKLRLLGLRNRYLLMLKNDTIQYFLRDILHITWYEIGVFLYILFFECATIYAYREAFSLRKKMKKKREFIQKRWPLYTQPYQYFV